MKPISDFLQQLIDEANTAIEKSQITIKEKLLSVYEQAKQEGFDPFQARKLMEEKITAVSDRYVRNILPDEAKYTEKARRPLKLPDISESEVCGTVPQISQEPKQNNVNITTNHEIIDTIEPEPTIDIHKASEFEQQPQPTPKVGIPFPKVDDFGNREQMFKLESDVDKYKKLAFDKQQQIEELEIKLERLTNQVNTQAEAIKQQQQQTQQIANTGKSLPLPATLHSKIYIEGKGDVQIDMKIFENGNVVCWVDNIEAQKQQAATKWRNV